MSDYRPIDLGPFWKDVNEHIIELVDLIPGEKLGWSPTSVEWNFRGTLVHLIGARYFFDMFTGGPPPNPDVLRDSSTPHGIKLHLNFSWDRVRAFISDDAKLATAYEIPSGDYKDPVLHTGHYIAYHRFVHDIQHRGDVMRYLSILGIDPHATARRRPF